MIKDYEQFLKQKQILLWPPTDLHNLSPLGAHSHYTLLGPVYSLSFLHSGLSRLLLDLWLPA